MYYVIKKNTIVTGKKEILLKLYQQALELPSDYEVNKYIIVDNALVLNSDFEAQKAQQRRNELDRLFLTRADVERAVYKARGMDFDDILELVKDNPEIDLKALKIELKANNFYRANPYINQIGAILGYSSDNLDYLFLNKELPEGGN